VIKNENFLLFLKPSRVNYFHQTELTPIQLENYQDEMVLFDSTRVANFEQNGFLATYKRSTKVIKVWTSQCGRQYYINSTLSMSEQE